MLAYQLAHCGYQVDRYRHGRVLGSLERSLIFGNGLFIRLRLIMGQHASNPCFIPAGRESL